MDTELVDRAGKRSGFEIQGVAWGAVAHLRRPRDRRIYEKRAKIAL
jgi:hypothetical protein